MVESLGAPRWPGRAGPGSAGHPAQCRRPQARPTRPAPRSSPIGDPPSVFCTPPSLATTRDLPSQDPFQLDPGPFVAHITRAGQAPGRLAAAMRQRGLPAAAWPPSHSTSEPSIPAPHALQHLTCESGPAPSVGPRPLSSRVTCLTSADLRAKELDRVHFINGLFVDAR